MKNIFKLTALAVFLCCLVSCDDDEPIIPTLEDSRQPERHVGTFRMERNSAGGRYILLRGFQPQGTDF